MFYFHLLLINSLINSSKLLASSTTLLKMLFSDDPDGWGGRRVEGRSTSPGFFPTQGLNLHLLHCRQILYHLSNLYSVCV